MFIINKAPHIFQVGDVRLLPGSNFVDDDQWSKQSGHPLVQARLENKTLEILQAPSQPAEVTEKPAKGSQAQPAAAKTRKSDITDIAALNPSVAVQLIQNTYRPDHLVAWSQVDNRPAVQQALAKQLTLITRPLGEDQP